MGVMIGFAFRSIFYNRAISFLFLAITFISAAFSFQSSSFPKREFRAVWIATVANLDWPLSKGASSFQQKAELDSLLTQLKDIGFNAVIFQIRPECDALYQSEIEPWSYWLTGSQGIPPDTLWDPLHYAIEAAHKRGMELHAWFNPLRAERNVGAYLLSPNHVVNTHPDWILTINNTLKILNPGIPDVRKYITNVVIDVVRRYNIDGVHWDDYFYPYPPNSISHEDDSTYSTFNSDFLKREDWRRNNINLLIKMVSDSIKTIKPWVKFGISPFGIWKTGTPEGITGRSGYDDVYCDAPYWMEQKYLDYLSPQLYWALGSVQNYSKLLSWWNKNANGRYIFPGQAAYLINEKRWNASEVLNQIRLNKVTISPNGNIFFRARSGIINNPDGFADSLKNDFYRYTSLVPPMPWLDSVPPLPPMNLTATIHTNCVSLQWQKPPKAMDDDSTFYFVLYRTEVPDTIDVNNVRQILSVTSKNSFNFIDSTVARHHYYSYAVTSVDKMHNESNFTSINIDTTPREEYTASLKKYPDDADHVPFSKNIPIHFVIPYPEMTSVNIYDVFGRKISTIVDEWLLGGEHTYLLFTGNLAPGMYLCWVISGPHFENQKIILPK